MKSILTLITLFVLASIAPRANAGNITIMNLSPYPYAGYLIASNVWPGASYATFYEQFITVPGSGGSLTFADPTALPSPSGPGLPALATGLFIGIKGYAVGAPSNNGAVGRAGNYMGYPLLQTNPPYYSVQWNTSGDNAYVLVMP